MLSSLVASLRHLSEVDIFNLCDISYEEATRLTTYRPICSFRKICSNGFRFESRTCRCGHAPREILLGHSRAVLRSFRLFHPDPRSRSTYRSPCYRTRGPNRSRNQIHDSFVNPSPSPSSSPSRERFAHLRHRLSRPPERPCSKWPMPY